MRFRQPRKAPNGAEYSMGTVSEVTRNGTDGTPDCQITTASPIHPTSIIRHNTARFYDQSAALNSNDDLAGYFEESGRCCPFGAQKVGDEHCTCRTCSQREAEGADRELVRSNLPVHDSGPGNAFLHCVWMCNTKRVCGTVCALAAGTGHEIHSRWGWPIVEQPISSAVDLFNNWQGRRCAGSSESCVDCCRQKLDDGDLWVLDQ